MTEAPGPSPSWREGRNPIVLDARGLRALAHPLRVRLLALLRKHGPATATGLAVRLDINSGSASYHLRRLDAAGFIAEDPSRGNGRERWWRSVHDSTELDSGALYEQEPEAARAFLQAVVTQNALRTQRALDDVETMPKDWRDALDLSDWHLRLTPAETCALRDELREVIGRYRRDRGEDTPDAPQGAERVGLLTYFLPELHTAHGPGEESEAPS